MHFALIFGTPRHAGGRRAGRGGGAGPHMGLQGMPIMHKNAMKNMGYIWERRRKFPPTCAPISAQGAVAIVSTKYSDQPHHTIVYSTLRYYTNIRQYS